LVCLAKGLGGGFPIGAVMARGKATDILQPGDHGSTFGGNPLACAVALAVLDTIENHRLAENAREVGAYLRQRLGELGQEIEDVRGAGLMVGCTLKTQNAREVVRACFEQKVILNATDDNTLRFVPPLILTKRQVDHAIATLADVLGVQVPKVAAVVGARPEPLHDVLAVDDLSDAQLEHALALSP